MIDSANDWLEGGPFPGGSATCFSAQLLLNNSAKRPKTEPKSTNLGLVGNLESTRLLTTPSNSPKLGESSLNVRPKERVGGSNPSGGANHDAGFG